MSEPLAVLIEVVTTRELLPRERRTLKNRLQFAVERSTPLFALSFRTQSDLLVTPEPQGNGLPINGEPDANLR